MNRELMNSDIWREMTSGRRYAANDPRLIEEINHMKDVLQDYNNIRSTDLDERSKMLKSILGRTGERVMIVQPFFCDYGANIEVGEDFFANFNFTVLDEAKVRIGHNAFIGPNVGIYTACHPLEPEERARQIEWAEPVTIGDNVWIGGGVTICPGVTIGDNVIIGAGSVVVKNIESDVVAVGNPAHVVKRLK